MMNIYTNNGMAEAIAWTTKHINQLNEGGLWVVPRSGTIVTVHHKERRAVIKSVMPDVDIAIVFEAMGWTVEEAEFKSRCEIDQCLAAAILSKWERDDQGH